MMFAFALDPPTIIAITGLLSVVGNIMLTIDSRRRSIHSQTTIANVVIPKLEELHKLTNGQSEKLNAVSKALGHAEGFAKGKETITEEKVE